MRLEEFIIGKTFWMGEKEWQCTDVGIRTVAAICLEDKKIAQCELGPHGVQRTIFLTRAKAEARG